MTQEAKERKDFLILGAAKGDRKSGKKELMRLGMYWVRPGGFFFITVSRSPRAVSSSLSSCKRNNSRDYHKKKSTGKKLGCYISFLITETNRWLLHRFASIKVIWVMVLQRAKKYNQNLPPSAVSLSEPLFPAVHASAPSACSSAAPHPLFPSSSLSPAIESHGHYYLGATNTIPSIRQRSKLETLGFFAIYF